MRIRENGMKQKPNIKGREKRHETKAINVWKGKTAYNKTLRKKKKGRKKKNIGLCYSKLLTQFTIIYLQLKKTDES